MVGVLGYELLQLSNSPSFSLRPPSLLSVKKCDTRILAAVYLSFGLGSTIIASVMDGGHVPEAAASLSTSNSTRKTVKKLYTAFRW